MLPEVRQCEMNNRDRLLLDACGLAVLLGVFDRDGKALTLNEAARNFFVGKRGAGCLYAGASSASNSAAADALPSANICCLDSFFSLEPQAYTDLQTAIHRGEANFSIVLPVRVPEPASAAVPPPQPPLSPPISPPQASSFTAVSPPEVPPGVPACSPRPKTTSWPTPPTLLVPADGKDGVLHAWLLSADVDLSCKLNHAGDSDRRVTIIGRASGIGGSGCGNDSDIGGGSAAPGGAENGESPPASRVMQRPLRRRCSSTDGNASGSWADEDTSSDSEGPPPPSPRLPLLPAPSSLLPHPQQQPWQQQAQQQLQPKQTQHAFPIAAVPIAVPVAPPRLEFPAELPPAPHIVHGSRISLSSSSSSAAPSQSTSLFTRAPSGVSSAGGWRLLTPALSRKWPRPPDGAEGASAGGGDSGSDYPQAPATMSNGAGAAAAADVQIFSADDVGTVFDLDTDVEAAFDVVTCKGGSVFGGGADSGGGSGGADHLIGGRGVQVGEGSQAAANSAVGQKNEIVISGVSDNDVVGGGSGGSRDGDDDGDESLRAGGRKEEKCGPLNAGSSTRAKHQALGGLADAVGTVTSAVGDDEGPIVKVASALPDVGREAEGGHGARTTKGSYGSDNGGCSTTAGHGVAGAAVCAGRDVGCNIIHQDLKGEMAVPPLPFLCPLYPPYTALSSRHREGSSTHDGVVALLPASGGKCQGGARSPVLADVGDRDLLPAIQRRASECLPSKSGICAGAVDTITVKCNNNHCNHHRHHNNRLHNHHSLADPNPYSSHHRSAPCVPSPPLCLAKCASPGSTPETICGKNHRGPRRCTTRERLLNLISSLDSDTIFAAASAAGDGAPYSSSHGVLSCSSKRPNGNPAGGNEAAGGLGCTVGMMRPCSTACVNRVRNRHGSSGRSSMDEVCGGTCDCCDGRGRAQVCAGRWGKTSPAAPTATNNTTASLRWTSPSLSRNFDARDHTSRGFDADLSPGSPCSVVRCSRDGDLLLTHGSPQQSPGLFAGCDAAESAHSARHWSRSASAAAVTQWPPPPPSHAPYAWFQVNITIKRLSADEAMASARQDEAAATAAAAAASPAAAAAGGREDPEDPAGGAGTDTVAVPSGEAGYNGPDAAIGTCTGAANAAVSSAAAGEVVLLFSATDVSEWVDSQERLEGLLQEEHKVLEAIFPRHVIEHVARKALTRPPSATFRPAACETNSCCGDAPAAAASASASASAAAAAASAPTRSKVFYNPSRSGGGEGVHTAYRRSTSAAAAATVRSAAAYGLNASSGAPSGCQGCITSSNTLSSVTSTGAASLEHREVPGGSRGIGADGGGRVLAAAAASVMGCSGPVPLPNADASCSGPAIPGGAAGYGGFLLPLATAHRCVTVLFADIVGFTTMCNCLEPLEVMNFLNGLYTRFDSLCDIYGVYKVETIGDCFMAVGGLITVDGEGFKAVRGDGSEDALHALKVMSFAKAMLREVAALVMPHNGSPLRLRVGLHSGPVTAGIVGAKMPRFCLFGDTVNTASRMESTCEPGAVHVSSATRDLLPEENWVATGGVQVKGKGEMQTFLWRPPPPLSECSSFGMGQLLSTRASAASKTSFQTLPPAGSAPPPAFASSWMAANGARSSMAAGLPFEPLPEAASAPLPGSVSPPPLPSPPRLLLPSPAPRLCPGICTVSWSAGIA